MADIQTEREAYSRYTKLLAEIEECRRVFEASGIPVPETLRRMLESGRNGKPPITQVHISPPHRTSRPPDAQEDWVSVPVEEGTATSLVLATLRKSEVPLQAGKVVDLVMGVNPKVPRGSVNNIGTRLGGTLITRNDDGWTLADRDKAPLLHGGFLWGPKEIFDKTELAAHRREAIIHILYGFSGGLQTVQIVEQLKRCNWVHAPASKDLVKADMELLEAHDKVRRISNSRKWEVVPGAKI